MSQQDFEDAIDEYLRLSEELDPSDPRLEEVKQKVAFHSPGTTPAPTAQHNWTGTVGAA